MENNIETLVVDNFGGRMTIYQDGDINSGYANVLESFGYDPFSRPGHLTWEEDLTQIDPGGSVITDLILAGKERVESGILYVYAIGHTGRLYKIQVNDPTTFNPDYDNPVLLATLAAESPTFTRGGFIDFYGATEKIYISHDKGLTSINFDGTGEAFVGVLGSWTQNVPKPIKQFLGSMFLGNGNNLAKVPTTGTVESYGVLSPSFPAGTQVRDLDVTPEGSYLTAVVTYLALPDITVGTPQGATTANLDSFRFAWNGTDAGYTSYVTYPAVSLESSILFGNYQYAFGHDIRGVGMFDPIERKITSGLDSSFESAPMPNAISSDGNMVAFACPLFFEDHLELIFLNYGGSDFEVGPGFWNPFGAVATAPETDINRVPYFQPVSNLSTGSPSNGFPGGVYGTAKYYFSTLETSSGPTTAYRFYRWSPVPTGSGTPQLGVYQTQNQVFSKKVQIKEVRVYAEPWVADNAFTVDLVGSAGTPMAGASKSFVAGTSLTVGDDYSWYNPTCAPTWMTGLRITNDGTANHLISKVEIDYSQGGK